MNNLIWETSPDPVDYSLAMKIMENYVKEIYSNNAPNKIWLLEHFDIFTKGTSASEEDFTSNNHNIPTINTSRGGKITYHGLGQRIIYPMINLSPNKDINLYISKLQDWIILTLQDLNIDAFKKKDLIGVWVIDNFQEKKIAALGVRVKKWIAYHGIAVNVDVNLDNYKFIIPCGISDFGVSSLSSLGKFTNYTQLDQLLKINFNKVFCDDKRN